MPSASLATNCKPMLGFSSKSAAIAALRDDGYTWGEIGRLLGMKARACSSLYWKMQKRATLGERMLTLQGNMFLDLEREARRRGQDVNRFAETLLMRIVTDKLYAAILDD